MDVAARNRRLAELVGRGCSRTEAAAAVGISRRYAFDLLRQPELKALMERTRTEMLDPEQAVLTDALSATRRDGSPDHQIRLKALELKTRFIPESDIEPDETIYEYDLPPGEPERAVLIVHRPADA